MGRKHQHLQWHNQRKSTATSSTSKTRLLHLRGIIQRNFTPFFPRPLQSTQQILLEGYRKRKADAAHSGHTKLLPHHLSTSPISTFVPSSLCHHRNLQRTNLQQILKWCEPRLSVHPSASHCYNRFHLTSEKRGDSKASGDKGVLGLPLKGFRSGALNMDKLLRQAFTQVYKHHGQQTPALQEFSAKA